MSPSERPWPAALRGRAIILRAITIAAAFALPVATISVLILSPVDIITAAKVAPPNQPLSALEEVVCIAVASIPVLLIGYGLMQLARAFAAIANGEYFSQRMFGSLRVFAASLSLSGFASLLVAPIVSLLVTWGNEERSLAISIGSPQLGLIFFGALLWVLAQLLERAAEIEAENREIV